MNTPFERGLADLRTGRRTLLKAGAAGLAISAASGVLSPGRAAAGPARRCYVLVIDGTRPEELDLGVTPNLTALRDGGLRFPRAQSLPVMETIPNHVMMMTGVRPIISGVPANSIYDRALGEVRDLDRETDIRVTTLLEQLRAAGHSTGTVLSKDYLYGVFGGRATYRWEPFPTLPVTEHSPDVVTVQALLAMVRDHDPAFVFANLGDIDRFGHADLTGGSLRVNRNAALADTDAQVGLFLDHLRRSGKWASSMVIVLADHSMDWSHPDRVVSLAGRFAADPLLAGRVQIADNGGADLCYWTGSPGDRAAAVAAMSSIARATPGVLEVHQPRDLSLGANAGDLVVYCKAGWRFSDPTPVANPIPGNHGHPATKPIPFFVAGGARGLPTGVSSASVTTMDVAPTVAAFFGIGAPATGWQGRALISRGASQG
ncbi:MAG TPA: alkaline phosphatase family protein [Nocardioides sp.]|uniref:alkaline phosphatase family protein n=1 Tax=Nocardioides sp. TaxID=35761 RepID=UPI002EDB57F7